MLRDPEFEKLLIRYPAIKAEAYELIQNALEQMLKKQRKRRHLSAAEVVHGLLEYAVGQYGPLAPSVLSEWGLNGPGDVGDAVYHLIEIGRLSASDDDNPADFPAVDFWFAAPTAPPLPKPGSLPFIDD